MRVLELFSGICGFSIGLERAGMRTVSFCEIEDHGRAVTAARFPGVPGVKSGYVKGVMETGITKMMAALDKHRSVSDAGV